MQKFTGLALGVILGAIWCPPALAQWLAMPSPDELAAAYPTAAREAGAVGRAELVCIVAADGRLRDCQVGFESPESQEFGLAALSLSSKFQIDMTSSFGAAAAGKRIRIPIRFGTAAGQPPLREAHFKQNRTYARYGPAGPYWPDRALRMKASGFVAVNCAVAPDLMLKDCEVVLVQGREFGFADAVLKMAQQGWMTAAPLDAGAAVAPGVVYRFEVNFAARGLR